MGVQIRISRIVIVALLVSMMTTAGMPALAVVFSAEANLVGNASAAPVKETYEPMQSTLGPTSGSLVFNNGLIPPDKPVMIDGVPAYIWTHGCGPTAVGMVVGYWDGHGFDNLVPGDASTQTGDVDQMIASDDHYKDYSCPLDNSWTGLLADKSQLGGAHASNCVADFMHTSWSSDGNYYGWSWSDMVDDAFAGYVGWVGAGYSVATTRLVGSFVTWDRFTHEIDSGHPLVFLVDSDADGYTDHFVPVIGYGVQNGVKMYACHDTWDLGVHWWAFAKMAKGQSFGIYDATCFEITTQEAYCASKGYGVGSTGVSWIESPATDCTMYLRLDNNGFKSAVFEVFDTTSGASTKIMHDTTGLRTQSAYPFGWAESDPVALFTGHTYEFELRDLDGSVGSYIVAYPMTVA